MSAPSALAASAEEVSVFITPLYGNSRQRAVCYLLEVDDCRILLDCGWTDSCDPQVVHELRSIAPIIDAVLLTHATVEHAGALPVLISQLHSKCTVFATQPVFRFGRLLARDAVYGHSHDTSFDSFSLDDVDATYEVDGGVKHLPNHCSFF